jgi:thiol-disulfide isomerase/thioredoxin
LKIKFYIMLAQSLLLAACTALPAQQPTNAPMDSGNSNQAAPNMPQPTPSPQGPAAANYPDLGPAPELTNEVWLNTSGPLHLKDLRGKVVLLDMWTFGCINCQHIIPSLKEWYGKYQSQGLVVIGNHFPEFDYEKDLGNLKDAVKQWQITYPIAQDNNGYTWSAYKTEYWPTIYLLDKQSHIRYVHIGEGGYQETEKAIRALLDEPTS